MICSLDHTGCGGNRVRGPFCQKPQKAGLHAAFIASNYACKCSERSVFCLPGAKWPGCLSGGPQLSSSWSSSGHFLFCWPLLTLFSRSLRGDAGERDSMPRFPCFYVPFQLLLYRFIIVGRGARRPVLTIWERWEIPLSACPWLLLSSLLPAIIETVSGRLLAPLF